MQILFIFTLSLPFCKGVKEKATYAISYRVSRNRKNHSDFSFLICEMRAIILPSSKGDYDLTLRACKLILNRVAIIIYSIIIRYAMPKLQKVTQSPFSSPEGRGTQFSRFFFLPSWHFAFTFIIALVHLDFNSSWDEVRVRSFLGTRLLLFSLLYSLRSPAVWGLFF